MKDEIAVTGVIGRPVTHSIGQAVFNRIGSVNLVKDRCGFNTDYAGFGLTVKKNGINFSGKKTIIAGTGGIFRTVYRYIIDNFPGSDITIKSRDPARARQVLQGMIEGENIVRESSEKYDILINCTPLGTYPDSGNPFEMKNVADGSTGIDAVYNPPETPFLRMIADSGGRSINGLDLYAGQAAETFRIIFGRGCKADIHGIAAEALHEAGNL